MNPEDPVGIAAHIAALLDKLGIRYVLGDPWRARRSVSLAQLSTSISRLTSPPRRLVNPTTILDRVFVAAIPVVGEGGFLGTLLAGAKARGGMADRRGRFDFELAPGQYRIQMRDILTGLVIGKDDSPVTIRGQAIANRSLRAKPIRLHVKLVPESGEELPCLAHLNVERDKDPNQQNSGMHSLRIDTPGLRLAPGQRETTVFVSPGSFTLSAVHYADALRASTDYRTETSGTKRITVTEADGHEATIKIKPSPTSDELAR